jgi:maltose alpha-D-glucosyltransferase/alpha-amylase
MLFTGKDFVIIDFEGDSERPPSARRIKTSPLRDVASMIHSLHCAAHAALMASQGSNLPASSMTSPLAPWMAAWVLWSSVAYLQGYLAEASQGGFLPRDRHELSILLDAWLLEKLVSELAHQLNDRPDWVPISLEAVLQLLKSK